MSSFSGQISSNNDAGEEGADNGSIGTVFLGSTSYKLKDNAGSQRYIALRFTSVTIAQGSTISAATVSPWINTSDSISGTGVYCEAADNSATLSSSSTNISSRTESTHSATWSATLTASAFNASPSIVNPVNDVISRPGFASGNALTVILDDGIGQNSNCAVEGYAGSPSEAAEISITYTAGGSAPGATTGVSASWSASNPTEVTVTFTQGSGTVTDNPIRYATQMQGSDAATSWTIFDPSAVSTSVTVTGLTAGVFYFFEAGAENSSGTTWSSIPVLQGTGNQFTFQPASDISSNGTPVGASTRWQAMTAGSTSEYVNLGYLDPVQVGITTPPSQFQQATAAIVVFTAEGGAYPSCDVQLFQSDGATPLTTSNAWPAVNGGGWLQFSEVLTLESGNPQGNGNWTGAQLWITDEQSTTLSVAECYGAVLYSESPPSTGTVNVGSGVGVSGMIGNTAPRPFIVGTAVVHSYTH